MPEILVVERDAKIRDLLIRFLGVKGYAVTATVDGTTGISRCLGDAPDLVLIDVQLPDMDGAEACRAMRDGGSTAALVLMGSARHAERSSIERARAELDMPEYLVKPFGVQTLMQAIESGLQHRTVRAADDRLAADSTPSPAPRQAAAAIISAPPAPIITTPPGVLPADAGLDNPTLPTIPPVSATPVTVDSLAPALGPGDGDPAESYGASSAGALLVDDETPTIAPPLGAGEVDVRASSPSMAAVGVPASSPGMPAIDPARWTGGRAWNVDSLEMEAVRHGPGLAEDDEARYVLEPMVPQAPTDPRGIYGSVTLPHLLFRCFRDLFTGRLMLSRGPVRKIVTLVNGRPISAESNIRSETLGYLLMQEGRIDQAQLTESARLARESSMRQGEALIRMGALDSDSLTKSLRRQLRKRIVSCFSWTGARYGLTYEPDVRAGVDAVEVNPLIVIFDGIKTSFPVAPLVKHFDERNRSPIRTTPRLRDYSTMLRPFAREMSIAGLCDGERTLGEVLSMSSYGLIDTLRILRALEITGCIEFDGQRQLAPASISGRASSPRMSVGGSLDGSLDGSVGLMGSMDSMSTRRVTRPRSDASRARPASDPSHSSAPSQSTSTSTSTSSVDRGSLSGNQDRDSRSQRSRRAYARRPETGPDLIKADANFAKGKRCLENEDLDNALAHFQLACKQDPHQPLFRMYRGWARFLLAPPQDKKARSEAHEEIKVALDDDPNQDEGFVLLGNVYRFYGKTDGALRLFRKALAINRRNPHANRAIREMEGRRILEDRDPQGLFGKFFNRR